jgi:hypothetical protein
MKKEYLIVTTVGLFALAYALDYFAGPVTIPAKNPFIIGQLISLYPFSYVGIGSRAIAIMLSTALILSVAESGLTKAIVGFFLAGLFELYAIQQLATLAKVTTTQWTLSFAYGGLLMAFPIVYFLISGILKSLHSKLAGGEKPQSNPPQSEDHTESSRE